MVELNESKPLYSGGVDSTFNIKLWENELLPRLKRALSKVTVYKTEEDLLLKTIRQELFGHNPIVREENLTDVTWRE